MQVEPASLSAFQDRNPETTRTLKSMEMNLLLYESSCSVVVSSVKCSCRCGSASADADPACRCRCASASADDADAELHLTKVCF